MMAIDVANLFVYSFVAAVVAVVAVAVVAVGQICSHAAGQEEGKGEGTGSQKSSRRRHQPFGVSSQNSPLATQRSVYHQSTNTLLTSLPSQIDHRRSYQDPLLT